MFGNSNNVKIQELQYEIKTLKEMLSIQGKYIQKLQHQVNSPAKHKVGDKFFKRYTICAVELKEVYAEFGYMYFEWIYKAFDSETNLVCTLKTDCRGCIIKE